MSDDSKPLEPITIRLRHPIILADGDEQITELTLRPPTGRDMRKLELRSGFEFDALLVLAGRLSGQPNPVIDKLRGDDLEEVLAVASRFMPGSRMTGEKY